MSSSSDSRVAQELAEIHASSFVTPRPWSAKEFDGLLALSDVFLATGEGPSFALGRVTVDEAEILTLAVAPKAREQGFGHAILSAFDAEAYRRGARRAFLEVSAENGAARTLYAAHGYRESGRRYRYYDGPEGRKIDALILSKSLKEA